MSRFSREKWDFGDTLRGQREVRAQLSPASGCGGAIRAAPAAR
ncbi:hypothetical protein [Gulosibacter massiliensis]|nr:hypothetical protein [Gulosibacter massiliensis]